MKIVKRQKLNEVVALQIKRHILDQGLRPGDRLPTEQEMADRFGVSRMSVREATKALGFLGIICAAPRRGLTVGEVDMGRISEYVGFHLAINDYPKLALLETRIVIEVGALPHVIRQMEADPAIYTRLNDLNQRLRECKNCEDRIELDIAFHRELLEASGLTPLVAFNDLLQIFFNRFRQSLLEAAWEEGIQSHQKLIDALRDGKLDTAANLLRQQLGYHRAML